MALGLTFTAEEAQTQCGPGLDHAEAGRDDVSYSLLTATSGRWTYWLRIVSKPGLRWYISHLLAMWWTSLVAQLVKNPPATQGTSV